MTFSSDPTAIDTPKQRGVSGLFFCLKMLNMLTFQYIFKAYFMKRAKQFWIKYKKWILIALVAIVLFSLFSGGGSQDAATAQTVVAKKGTLEEVVNITGRVKPAQEVDLSFERGGVVRTVNVEVGQTVVQGATLASISNGDVQGRLQEAQAGLDAARATLDELKRGARPEEIRVKETALQSAKQDLANSYINVPDVLRSAFANASDAVQVKLSLLFDGRTGSEYKLTFTSCDAQTEIDVTNLRLSADIALKNIQRSIDTVDVTNADAADLVLKNAYSDLQKLDQFVRRTSDLLTVSCALANKDLDGYRSSVTLAKIPVNAALLEVSTKRNAIASQKLLVERANNELAITLSGTDTERIRAQEAAVKQAQARVTQAYADVSQTVITAPFTGKITSVDAKKGQYTSPSVPVIFMISDSTFEIEAKIPEVDIARVKVQNKASVWIEAFGKEETFEAVVTKIDPAETVSDGVSTYKATLQFVVKDDRVKSGMTANVDIITSQKENVVSVPARAVQIGDNGRFVTVKDGETTKEVSVKQGILGSDGEREILEGLQGGEEIIIPASK